MKEYLILSLVALFISCNTQKRVKSNKKDSIIILVSKNTKGRYAEWLIKMDTSIIYVDMYSIKNLDSIDYFLNKANGIIISGGEDVYPGLFGKEAEITRCGKIDTYRDSLEIKMIKFALQNKIPILGICRGLQIMNVAQGGSLIIDIPTDIGSDTLHRNKGKTFHTVYLDTTSYLYSITKVDSGEIYSNHHQAIDKMADEFRASSFAKDKVIEAIELQDTSSHPFVLAIQWHPEMMEANNPLSYNIGKVFLYKVKQ